MAACRTLVEVGIFAPRDERRTAPVAPLGCGHSPLQGPRVNMDRSMDTASAFHALQAVSDVMGARESLALLLTFTDCAGQVPNPHRH